MTPLMTSKVPSIDPLDGGAADDALKAGVAPSNETKAGHFIETLGGARAPLAEQKHDQQQFNVSL